MNINYLQIHITYLYNLYNIILCYILNCCILYNFGVFLCTYIFFNIYIKNVGILINIYYR
jgi:hypothetical protein